MPRQKDQAICIRHLDWSETSQVVVLLAREHGRLRGIAKGSKRFSPSSIARFSGGIELLTRGEVLFVTKPTSDLAAITEWDLQETHPHLRRDLTAHRVGMYAADLANALLADHDPHPPIYDALASLLADLADPLKTQATLLQFQWTLLDDAGYRPELFQDASTGDALPAAEMYGFDPQAGGLTATTNSNDWRVRHETVELLRAVAGGQTPASADPAALVRANRLLCVYIRAMLDQELPTMTYVLRDRP